MDKLYIKEKRTIAGVNMNEMGLFLFYVYVFFSYIANNVVLPSVISSYSLYLFLGYSLFYCCINRKLKISSVVCWLGVFMLFSLFSMLYSPEKNIFGGTFYLLIVNIVLVFLLSQYTITMKEIVRIGWIYVLSASVLIFLLLITGNIVDKTGRLGFEMFGNANSFATMLMISTLYTIWMLVYLKNTKWGKCVLMLCFFLEYLGMFLSGGRKYIVIPLLFLYILLLFKQDSTGKRHIIKYTFIIMAVAAILWILIMKVPVFYEHIGVRMEGMLSFFIGNKNEADDSTLIRAEMMELAIKRWIEKPIFGYGFDSFKYYNRIETGNFYYSHNNWLEMLYNTGIIGFVLYYWYYVKILITAWKKKDDVINKGVSAFIIAMVVSMFIYEYGAINYTSTSTMIMFFVASVMLKLPKENLNNML